MKKIQITNENLHDLIGKKIIVVTPQYNGFDFVIGELSSFTRTPIAVAIPVGIVEKYREPTTYFDNPKMETELEFATAIYCTPKVAFILNEHLYFMKNREVYEIDTELYEYLFNLQKDVLYSHIVKLLGV
jgi:hypothetical protein